jgi:MFS family permease
MLYPFATATYVPCATILFEWFSERRGLAAGIMYAGTGVGGTIFPFLISGLINRFGYKAAMVSMGLGYGIIGSLALLPIKRRVPLPRRRGSEVVGNEGLRRPRASLRFMKDWYGSGLGSLWSVAWATLYPLCGFPVRYNGRIRPWITEYLLRISSVCG